MEDDSRDLAVEAIDEAMQDAHEDDSNIRAAVALDFITEALRRDDPDAVAIREALDIQALLVVAQAQALYEAAAALGSTPVVTGKGYDERVARQVKAQDWLRERGDRLLIEGKGCRCSYMSFTGVDTTDMSDPAKLWKCDNCGRVGTSDELESRT